MAKIVQSLTRASQEYEEDERWLHESIEANIHFAKADSLDKVTSIGGN